MKTKINLPDVKKLPHLILKTGLPVIVATLLYIAWFTYSNLSDPSTLRQSAVMLEHALMSLILVLGGALLANTIQEQ